jgi:NAD(P)-dependent dehydrogenase (short-subunit alcohol dehydrogenase family)
VEGLGRALAVELAPIRVNICSPGFTATPRLEASESREQLEAFYTSRAKKLPLKRVGQAQDIAEAILYLMNNPYTTGHTLFVDGGHTLR